jgi:hypothetical protein
MALVAGRVREQLSFRDTSIDVNVAETPSVKACYYLHCVQCVMKEGTIPWCYRNFESANAGARSRSDCRELLGLIERYSPTAMHEFGLWYQVADGQLTRHSNCFIEMASTQQLTAIGVSISSAVAMQVRRGISITIMLYMRRWVDRYYYEAKRGLEAELQSCRFV